jgi:hypothetical protein
VLAMADADGFHRATVVGRLEDGPAGVRLV